MLGSASHSNSKNRKKNSKKDLTNNISSSSPSSRQYSSNISNKKLSVVSFLRLGFILLLWQKVFHLLLASLRQIKSHITSPFHSLLFRMVSEEYRRVETSPRSSTSSSSTSETPTQYPMLQPSKLLPDEETVQKYKKKLESFSVDERQAEFDKEKNQGNECFNRSRYETAIHHYTKAILCDPSSAVAYSNRAMAFLKVNKYSQVLEDCNEALRIDPNYTKAKYRRGLALHHKNFFAEALQDFEDVVRNDSNNFIAQHYVYKIRELLNSQHKKMVLLSTNIASSSSEVLRVPEKDYLYNPKYQHCVQINEWGLPKYFCKCTSGEPEFVRVHRKLWMEEKRRRKPSGDGGLMSGTDTSIDIPRTRSRPDESVNILAKGFMKSLQAKQSRSDGEAIALPARAEESAENLDSPEEIALVPLLCESAEDLDSAEEIAPVPLFCESPETSESPGERAPARSILESTLTAPPKSVPPGGRGPVLRDMPLLDVEPCDLNEGPSEAPLGPLGCDLRENETRFSETNKVTPVSETKITPLSETKTMPLSENDSKIHIDALNNLSKPVNEIDNQVSVTLISDRDDLVSAVLEDVKVRTNEEGNREKDSEDRENSERESEGRVDSTIDKDRTIAETDRTIVGTDGIIVETDKTVAGTGGIIVTDRTNEEDDEHRIVIEDQAKAVIAKQLSSILNSPKSKGSVDLTEPNVDQVTKIDHVVKEQDTKLGPSNKLTPNVVRDKSSPGTKSDQPNKLDQIINKQDLNTVNKVDDTKHQIKLDLVKQLEQIIKDQDRVGKIDTKLAPNVASDKTILDQLAKLGSKLNLGTKLAPNVVRDIPNLGTKLPPNVAKDIPHLGTKLPSNVVRDIPNLDQVDPDNEAMANEKILDRALEKIHKAGEPETGNGDGYTGNAGKAIEVTKDILNGGAGDGKTLTKATKRHIRRRILKSNKQSQESNGEGVVCSDVKAEVLPRASTGSEAIVNEKSDNVKVSDNHERSDNQGRNGIERSDIQGKNVKNTKGKNLPERTDESVNTPTQISDAETPVNNGKKRLKRKRSNDKSKETASQTSEAFEDSVLDKLNNPFEKSNSAFDKLNAMCNNNNHINKHTEEVVKKYEQKMYSRKGLQNGPMGSEVLDNRPIEKVQNVPLEKPTNAYRPLEKLANINNVNLNNLNEKSLGKFRPSSEVDEASLGNLRPNSEPFEKTREDKTGQREKPFKGKRNAKAKPMMNGYHEGNEIQDKCSHKRKSKMTG
ncbi:hypothetical protein M8J77_026099 [Diaphorina citri]|nr:hypothetical protein M8J77_026099 [Diaphorina citri]